MNGPDKLKGQILLHILYVESSDCTRIDIIATALGNPELKGKKSIIMPLLS